MEDPDLLKEAWEYWQGQSRKRRDMAHWRGQGRWVGKDETWLRIGRDNLDRCRKKAFLWKRPFRGLDRMLEWGPGGGSNVLAFSQVFREIVGIDISKKSLDECQKQCDGKVRFIPMLIPIDYPEAIAGTGPFDFFISTAVIQHMPSFDLVDRKLSAVAKEMDSRGWGVVQIKFASPKILRNRIEGGYTELVASWIIYNLNDFVLRCKRAGWKVLGSEKRFGKHKAGNAWVYLAKA